MEANKCIMLMKTFDLCLDQTLLQFIQADVGQYLGIASSVNITRTVIQTNVILMDDGGNGNILVRLLLLLSFS